VITAGEVPLARNREEDSKFPYLLRVSHRRRDLPKAREAWPSPPACAVTGSTRPADAEILDRADVVSCRRRARPSTLVLDRPAGN
jgi:hypothetical protein